MPIHILSEDLAAKIAAGEVIERPASVVKELVENALDAKARDIRIEVRGGGQRLIRVADDGSGIPADQVELAFARHGTSKLQSIEDLSAIRTLGFRGEALPSIAAVARVTLVTREATEAMGTLFRTDNSRVVTRHPHGAPRGTVVTVEDLFASVPARLKFLKSPGAEAAQIAELVHALAMAYPAVRFSLVNDGRLVFQSSGSGRLADVLFKVFGADIARGLIPVDGGEGDEVMPETGQQSVEAVTVRGFVSPPSIHRATRKGQYLFINGRWVDDRAIAHAVIEAYHTLLMVGRFPLFVVNITLKPDAVDVNVHPMKSQVRLREPGVVYRVVQREVRRALAAYAPVPPLRTPFTPGVPSKSYEWISPRQDGTQGPEQGTTAAAMAVYQKPASQEVNRAGGLTELSGPPAPVAVPMLRVLGQIASTFIICEGPDGMYLVDQHAAHERVLYDKLISEAFALAGTAQQLLEPVVVNLTPVQWNLLAEQHLMFGEIGFQIENFGGTSVMVRAVPAVLARQEPAMALTNILDEILQGEPPLATEQQAQLITHICKFAAVKAGQTLTLEEMRTLVRDLEKSTNARTCPHGRPTMVQLNLALLEREFGRRG